MIGAIIIFIAVPICSYWLGYYGSKINTLNEFKTVDYQRGHALGLIHAIEMIQNSNMF